MEKELAKADECFKEVQLIRKQFKRYRMLLDMHKDTKNEKED